MKVYFLIIVAIVLGVAILAETGEPVDRIRTIEAIVERYNVDTVCATVTKARNGKVFGEDDTTGIFRDTQRMVCVKKLNCIKKKELVFSDTKLTRK